MKQITDCKTLKEIIECVNKLEANKRDHLEAGVLNQASFDIARSQLYKQGDKQTEKLIEEFLSKEFDISSLHTCTNLQDLEVESHRLLDERAQSFLDFEIDDTLPDRIMWRLDIELVGILTATFSKMKELKRSCLTH